MKNLAFLRIEAGLTIRDLAAEKINGKSVSTETITLLETGKRKNPRLMTLKILAKILENKLGYEVQPKILLKEDLNKKQELY